MALVVGWLFGAQVAQLLGVESGGPSGIGGICYESVLHDTPRLAMGAAAFLRKGRVPAGHVSGRAGGLMPQDAGAGDSFRAVEGVAAVGKCRLGRISSRRESPALPIGAELLGSAEALSGARTVSCL